MRTEEQIRKEFFCLDCKRDTFRHEYYMIHNDLWNRAIGIKAHKMLCVLCLEGRIGRKLNKNDFTNAPINNGMYCPQSNTLKDRLKH